MMTPEGGMMTTNAELITGFYEAFQRKDHVAMNASYHEAAGFTDPVFRNLDVNGTRAMWHMLCERGSDLVIDFRDVSADGDRGSAHWDATYTLAGSDRRIHNSIDAKFLFKDGLIYRHMDTFDLWKWTRMALGTPGTLLGWSGPLQSKVRDMARRQLDRFISEHPEYGG